MYFTFTGNEPACSAAYYTLHVCVVRAIKLMRECMCSFFSFAVMGDLLAARLRKSLAGHPAVKDIRGRGLFYGIEINVSRDAVVKAALDRDVWVYPAGSGPVANAVMLAPPFVVSEAEIEKIVTALREALDEVASR